MIRKLMQRQDHATGRWGAYTFAFVAIGWLSIASGYAAERATDETIHSMFGKAHNVMKEQRERLQLLLDAFVSGDAKAIERYAQEIASNMGEVSRLFPPKPGKEAAQWKAMADIVGNAQQLQEDAEKGKYQQAYAHFSTLTKRCILCHQARRSWGVFPEPEASKPADASGAPEADTGMEK